jgi:hypothetical protein
MAGNANFSDWLSRAWDEHAGDPPGVAARLEGEGLAAAGGDGDLQALAGLAHHLHGEHLGTPDAGRALIERLAHHPLAGDGTRAACRRLDASLRVTAEAGDAGDAAGFTGPLLNVFEPSDRVRVIALAAGNLAERDPGRSGVLLRRAVRETQDAALPDDDPAVRTLAATGHNIACSLEELPRRSPGQVETMILAAQTSRQAWSRAGTWLETERAEYRLAMTWLAAGDARQAQAHAQACLGIVRSQGDVALEAFFAWEAMGRCARALGDPAGHAQALASAGAAFDRLEPDDVDWVRPSLEQLAHPLRA